MPHGLTGVGSGAGTGLASGTATGAVVTALAATKMEQTRAKLTCISAVIVWFSKLINISHTRKTR